MSDHIPPEVLADILGRLSPWDVRMLRCVNKEWRSIIDEHDFLPSQLRRCTSLFVTCLHGSVPTYLRYEPATFGPSSEGPVRAVTYDSFLSQHAVFMGSCHGLLCVGYPPAGLLLFNPALPEEKRVITDFMSSDPMPPLLGRHLCEWEAVKSSGIEWISFGFGYDKVAGDYKAVIVARRLMKKGRSYILTYRFGTESFSAFPYNMSSKCFVAAPLRGALHWTEPTHKSYIDSDLIYSFDLGTDSMNTFRQPADYGADRDPFYITVGVVDSCLAVCATFVFKAAEGLDVWMMREYGRADSWCRLHSVEIPLLHRGYLYYAGTLNGHILMTGDMGMEIMWVDTSSGTVHSVHSPPGYNNLYQAHLCLESPFRIGEAPVAHKASGEESSS